MIVLYLHSSVFFLLSIAKWKPTVSKQNEFEKKNESFKQNE